MSLSRELEQRIERVKEAASIKGVVERVVKLKRVGHEWKGLCPFHNEKSPSFYAIPRKAMFHCFGCGKTGDAIGFVEAHDRLPFLDALAKLERDYGLAPPPGATAEANAVRPAPPASLPAPRTAPGPAPARPADAPPYWLPWWRSAERQSPMVARYLAARGVPEEEIELAQARLRFARLQFQPLDHGPILPAMLAPLARFEADDWVIVGLHVTWLAADGEGKAGVNPAKQFHGSPRGACIPFTGWRPHTVSGEGIETVLSFGALARLRLIDCPADVGLVCAASLGNWAGREDPPRYRDPHPWRVDAKGRPVGLPSVTPDLTPEGCAASLVPPPSVARLDWAQDRDGRDRPSHDRLAQRGVNRSRALGLESCLRPAPEGMDFNDPFRLGRSIDRFARGLAA